MQETAYDIRTAYFSLLNGQLGSVGASPAPIPIYNKQIPNGSNPSVYVLMSTQRADSNNTKSSFNTDSTMQLTIISKAQGNNSGALNDQIAEKIYNIIYPSPVGSVISSQRFQVLSTELISDNTLDAYEDGQYIVIERVIVFQHKTAQIV